MPLQLDPAELDYLQSLLNKGVHSARKLKRVRVFLALAQGATYDQAARQGGVCHATVSNLLSRYRTCGKDLKQALEEKPGRGKRSRLTAADEAALTALACSAAPEGRGQWTLRLLRDKAVELEYLPEGTSHETLRQYLKKANLNLGSKGNGASAR